MTSRSPTTYLSRRATRTGVDNVTGYYGDLTEQAVKDYQKAAGFEVTGVADNKTIKALFMSDAPKGVLPEGVSNEP